MPLRSFWKGSISFGLVNIPVRLYSATEDRPVKFNLLHKKCHTRIQFRRYCPLDKVEVPNEEIARGYPISKDQYVILDERDFENVQGSLTRSIEVVNFVHLEEINPIYYDRAYYLVPQEMSAKAYGLLRDAMNKTGLAALGHAAFHEKGHLILLRAMEDIIGLETLYYNEDVRCVSAFANELPHQGDASPKEMEMAVELMRRLTAKFDPAQYHDTYRRQLMEMIRRKIEGKEIATPESPKGTVLDLAEALKASLNQTREKSKEKRRKTA